MIWVFIGSFTMLAALIMGFIYKPKTFNNLLLIFLCLIVGVMETSLRTGIVMELVRLALVVTILICTYVSLSSTKKEEQENG